MSSGRRRACKTRFRQPPAKRRPWSRQIVPDPEPRERFLVLDGIRAVAAFAVIVDHVPSPLLMSLLPGRYLAVDFFFALSGFVLAHVYVRRFAAGLGAFEFMRMRVARLYPLYIAATLAGALLAAFKISRGYTEAGWPAWAATTVLNAAYLPTLPALTTLRDQPFPFNGPAWSLFFELVVNVVFAFVVLRLTRRLLAPILMFGAAGVVWSAFHFGQLDGGWLFSNFVAGFARVFYAFFAGVFVYRLRAIWRVPAIPAWLSPVLLLAILAAPSGDALRPAWQAFAAIVLFPLLIAVSADARVSGGPARVCAAAGALSYGFYVCQAPVRDWLDLLTKGVEMPGVARVLFVAAVTLVVVALLRRVYEPVARRVIASGLAPRRGRPEAQPATGE